jgi:hypothetical protein
VAFERAGTRNEHAHAERGDKLQGRDVHERRPAAAAV